MQFRRLFAPMGLVLTLVVSLTVPAPAQKPGKRANSGKLSSGTKPSKGVASQKINSIMPRVTDCAVKSPITSGVTVNGVLQSGDCTLGDGTFFDEYTFSGTAG